MIIINNNGKNDDNINLINENNGNNETYTNEYRNMIIIVKKNRKYKK